MTKTTLVRLAAIAATVLIAPNAHALLIGNTVKYDYFYPDLSTPIASPLAGNYVVGPGVEIPGMILAGDFATVDLSDTNISIDVTAGQVLFFAGAFNGPHFSDVFGMIADFTSVTVDAATTAAGFTASRITFDANNIYLNFQGLTFDFGQRVSVNIAAGSPTTVPEPGTLALLGLGALAAGVLRRRRAS